MHERYARLAISSWEMRVISFQSLRNVFCWRTAREKCVLLACSLWEVCAVGVQLLRSVCYWRAAPEKCLLLACSSWKVFAVSLEFLRNVFCQPLRSVSYKLTVPENTGSVVSLKFLWCVLHSFSSFSSVFEVLLRPACSGEYAVCSLCGVICANF